MSANASDADRPAEGKTETRRSFDWYAALLAAGITVPFAIWGLFVIFSPHYIVIGVMCAVFITLVFWGFGRLRVG
ncbi:MAG TPA: hypothetical protein P5572_12625 [Phycisphaerae bacterium]|nr:hypothetical protein [Phycisphaerae bacterium]